MDLIRVGDKVISRDRIYQTVNRILELRAGGLSQQDVAEQLGLERTLISRLETMGELRKGKKIALAGFPIENCAELREMALREGVDFVLLMTETERNDFARSMNGADLLNQVMGLIARARECDAVVFIGSDQRIRMIEALVGPHVIGIELGSSPIHEDKYVEPETIRRLVRNLKAN